MKPIDQAALQALRSVLDPKAVIAEEDHAPFLEEWRGRWPGETPMVIAPSSTEELAGAMKVCAEHRIAVVPQGGNTGLVGGGAARGEIIVTTKRMRQVRDLSAQGFTMTLEAGVTLQEAQDLAREKDRLFPLSIGAEGTANIGGVLSTNAGGVHVLRYGNARDLVLGLEVVLPDGRVWNGLNALRKNNTGYDLKHLFIGGEGTLGIITAAVLKLYPRPRDSVTALLAVPDAEAAVDMLSLCQERSGGQLGSFELMNRAMVDLVLEHFPDLPRPVQTETPFYVLAEFASGQGGVLRTLSEKILEEAFERELVLDGTIAADEKQAEALWHIRHNASEAMKNDPSPCVKCDVSVPIGAIPSFLKEADEAVLALQSGARIIAFGHMGDGNIHYDILGPEDGDHDQWRSRMEEFEARVHDVVVGFGGSISAEHGIGQLKRDELAERKTPVEMDLMRTIKRAIDPDGLMNPGKLLKP
jgi:FAD/FMN-containing dehydrogenase